MCSAILGEMRRCDPGWLYYKDDELCFQVDEDIKNFSAARQNCFNKGGHLAYIKDNNKHQHVSAYLTTKGLSKWNASCKIKNHVTMNHKNVFMNMLSYVLPFSI